MTSKQRIYLMADLWPKACEAQGWDPHDRAKRLEVIGETLHRHVSSASEITTEDEYDMVKNHMLYLADNVQGTREELHHEIPQGKRLLWKHKNIQLKLLKLYVDNVSRYVYTVLRNRFKICKGLQSVEDLSPLPHKSIVAGVEKTKPSQLLMFIMTLDRCIDQLRQEHGDTVHEMNLRAGVPCRCAQCLQSPGKKLSSKEVSALFAQPKEEDPF